MLKYKNIYSSLHTSCAIASQTVIRFEGSERESGGVSHLSI